MATEYIRKIKQEDAEWVNRSDVQLEVANARAFSRQLQDEAVRDQRQIEEVAEKMRRFTKTSRLYRRLNEDRLEIVHQNAEAGPSTLIAGTKLNATLSLVEMLGFPKPTGEEAISRWLKRLDISSEKTFEATKPEVRQLLAERFGTQEWTCEAVSYTHLTLPTKRIV